MWPRLGALVVGKAGLVAGSGAGAVLAQQTVNGDNFGWLQIILQAGAFGLLVLLVWKVPGWMNDARMARARELESQTKEREAERLARLQEAKEEREARHSLANQFHNSIMSMMAAMSMSREEDRKAFEARNDRMISAIEHQTERMILANAGQTEQLVSRLDKVHEGVTDVQKMVVKAGSVTVVPEKSH